VCRFSAVRDLANAIYKLIKVKYQNLELQTRIKTYTGWTAQIIQHEVDHCEGILI
ncbi:MAG: peptide deformylase, partial [Ruminiclostridium sp.]|nr:peptide deformylase [Ruminiclostridium sp.]